MRCLPVQSKKVFFAPLIVLAFGGWLSGSLANASETWDGAIVQYGSMREAIGQQQDQGRVRLGALLEREHLFAVAALAELRGEITIVDGHPIVTRANTAGTFENLPPEQVGDAQATMLAGAYVPRWREISLPVAMSQLALESFIAARAERAGLDSALPFPFQIEGTLTDLRLHVINGACPIHARMNRIELAPEQQPAVQEAAAVDGKLIGVFARDAVGRLTHPATAIHSHVVLRQPSGEEITGHVEAVGVAAGAVLRLPELD
jgi:hypothetical protein